MENDNNKTETRKGFAEDFSDRIKAVKTTRWIRFGIVAALFLAWTVWMQTWWLAIFELLLFDIYITGYINFTWWKKSKNKTLRSVMSWVDAIVYALILVAFIFPFIGQNYQIPSSSLEKTLLTGDYLWVNKTVYGPRVPMTPVNFPLVHSSLFGIKSYLDSPSLPYKRLKGLRNVEEGDIVVFNFPAGDTVATKFEESPRYYETLVQEYGRDAVKNNKAVFGDVIYRPVDRRTHFVKRAVGLPGDRLKIVDDTIYINGVAREFPENVQFNYIYATSAPITAERFHELGITLGDVMEYAPGSLSHDNLAAIIPGAGANSMIYVSPLTSGMIDELTASGTMLGNVKVSKIQKLFQGGDDRSAFFPYGNDADWTLSDYGGENGLYIPKKGDVLRLDPQAWRVYNRVIRNYEGHSDAYLDEATGKVIIDGQPADYYKFAMDYYFMMGDNRDNSQDSRFWGFVPEDHIVGTPMVVLASFDTTRSLFDGKIRWDRILRDANPDK